MAHAAVTADDPAATLFAAAPRRQLLILKARASNVETVRVGLGETASATVGLELAAGEGLTVDGPATPTGAITVYGSSGVVDGFESERPANTGP